MESVQIVNKLVKEYGKDIDGEQVNKTIWKVYRL